MRQAGSSWCNVIHTKSNSAIVALSICNLARVIFQTISQQEDLIILQYKKTLKDQIVAMTELDME